jgi:hypothetical protein
MNTMTDIIFKPNAFLATPFTQFGRHYPQPIAVLDDYDLAL